MRKQYSLRFEGYVALGSAQERGGLLASPSDDQQLPINNYGTNASEGALVRKMRPGFAIIL